MALFYLPLLSSFIIIRREDVVISTQTAVSCLLWDTTEQFIQILAEVIPSEKKK